MSNHVYVHVFVLHMTRTIKTYPHGRCWVVLIIMIMTLTHDTRRRKQAIYNRALERTNVTAVKYSALEGAT